MPPTRTSADRVNRDSADRSVAGDGKLIAKRSLIDRLLTFRATRSGSSNVSVSGADDRAAASPLQRALGFVHRRRRHRADIATIQASGRFAHAWYAARYMADDPQGDPVRHYVMRGSALGLAPHPLFDPAWYRARYDDVRAAGVEPFVHYLTRGAIEGRDANPWVDQRFVARDGSLATYDPLSGEEPPGGRFGRRFTAREAAEPLQALHRFLHEDLHRGSVGVVELRTRDFVSGWMAAESDIAHLEIVVDGHIGTVGHFNPRPDITKRLGRPAKGFLFAFARPLGGCENVEVRFAGGGPLHGSPYRHAAPSADARCPGEPHVHLDAPIGAIRCRLVKVAGWIRVGDGDPEIEIRTNGRRHHAFFELRTDVIEQLDDPFCVGFRFPFDVAAATVEDHSELDLEILVDGVPIDRRSLPFELAPLPVQRPKLNLFMHIPKTAGISVANAISGLPDARALWLYDRGPMAIDDQLARLSQGAFDDLRFVGGHFLYGIHRRIARPCEYVAFVREPVSYLKSFYLYMKYVAVVPAFSASDIYTLLGTRYEFDNAFTRWFAAVPAGRPVEQADLDRALATMERDFAFVGLLERMDESIARLSKLWGVDLPVLRENRTPAVAEAARIDLRDLARASEANTRFDKALVARVETLFWA